MLVDNFPYWHRDCTATLIHRVVVDRQMMSTMPTGKRQLTPLGLNIPTLRRSSHLPIIWTKSFYHQYQFANPGRINGPTQSTRVSTMLEDFCSICQAQSWTLTPSIFSLEWQWHRQDRQTSAWCVTAMLPHNEIKQPISITNAAATKAVTTITV